MHETGRTLFRKTNG